MPLARTHSDLPSFHAEMQIDSEPRGPHPGSGHLMKLVQARAVVALSFQEPVSDLQAGGQLACKLRQAESIMQNPAEGGTETCFWSCLTQPWPKAHDEAYKAGLPPNK